MQHVDEALLHAYLDEEERGGALGADARVAVDAHLAGCAECRKRLDEVAALRGATREVLRAGSPADFGLPGLPSLPAAAPRQRRAWLPLAWAASLVMAVGAGWMASALLRTPAPRAASEQAVPSVAPVDTAVRDAAATSVRDEAVVQPAAPAAAPAVVAPQVKAEVSGAVASTESAREERASLVDSSQRRISERARDAVGQANKITVTGAPAPAPAQSLVQERERAARLLLTEPIAVDSAEALLGATLHVLPGVPIQGVVRTPEAIDPVQILVTQQTPGGTVSILHVRRIDAASDLRLTYQGILVPGGTTVERAGLTITVAAPPAMSTDSLAAMLVPRRLR